METLRSPPCVCGPAGGGSQLARRSSVLREGTVRESVSPASPQPVTRGWPGPHRSHASTTTSDQTRRPAEFKHITKRRKRN